MSPTGLLKFASSPGSTIYEKTHRKLLAWHERWIATGLSAPDADVVAPAVDILTRRLAVEVGAAEARRVRKQIAQILGEAYAHRLGVDEVVGAALGE